MANILADICTEHNRWKLLAQFIYQNKIYIYIYIYMCVCVCVCVCVCKIIIEYMCE